MLRIDKVSKAYGPTRALEAFSLQLEPGNIFGLLGANGAGKSTLLKILMGQETPDQGQLLWDNAAITTSSPSWKRKLGYAPEAPEVFPYLTFGENLLASAALWGVDKLEAKRRAASLARFFCLEDAANTWGRDGSFGMQKKLSLALALIHNPEVLLLDEPFNGLDALGCIQVQDLLGTLAKKGKIVMITSHVLAGLDAIIDGLGIMSNGQLVFAQEKAWKTPAEGLEAFYFSHLHIAAPQAQTLSWLT